MMFCVYLVNSVFSGLNSPFKHLKNIYYILKFTQN